MGSTLGHYIHYRASNYDKHGTTYKGRFDKMNDTLVMSNIEKKIDSRKSSLTKKDIEELSELLSSFLKEPEKFKRGAEVHQAVEQRMLERLRKVVKEGTVNTKNIRIDGINTNNMIGIVHAHKTPEGQLYLDLKEITQKINKLEEVYLRKMNQKTVRTREFQQLKSLYRNLVHMSAAQLKKYDFVANQKNLPLHLTSPSDSGYSLKKLRDLLNQMITEYAAYPDIANIEGLGFEDMLALFNYAIEVNATDSINDVLRRAAQGSKTMRIQQYKDNFTTKAYRRALGKNTFLDTEMNLRSKIDVILRWKGEDMKISAKNISIQNNQYSWITSVEGSPLAYMIQDADGQFINHWINMHVVYESEDRYSDYRKQNKQDADNTMKRLIHYKAMTGDTFGRDQNELAEWVVVNDKTGKRPITIKNIADIYQNSLKRLQTISLKIDGKNINSVTLKNTWHEQSYEGRIAQILHQLHSMKIKSSFNFFGTMSE